MQNKLLIKFFIKSILITVLCAVILGSGFAEVLYKGDISLDYVNVVSVIIIVVTAVLTAFFSVSGFKNNGLLLGIISEFPLLIICTINLIFSHSGFIYYVIKLLILVLIGGVVGILKVKNNSKFKV